jgi:hypothetical protein
MEEQPQLFRHLVAKHLYLCKQMQQDIMMKFPVLLNRIKSSQVEEYKQLTCVMQFLRHTAIHVDHGTHLLPHYKFVSSTL